MILYDVLQPGIENAMPSRDLELLFNCTAREIRAEVERERRAGKPICASIGGNNTGYYLPKDLDELQRYCDSIGRRRDALTKTRAALLKVLKTGVL